MSPFPSTVSAAIGGRTGDESCQSTVEEKPIEKNPAPTELPSAGADTSIGSKAATASPIDTAVAPLMTAPSGGGMSWIQWVMFILNLLPTVLQLIQTIEAQIGAGQGATKKEAVINAVQAAAMHAGANQNQIDQAVAMAGPFIDSHVGLLNQSGAFKSS